MSVDILSYNESLRIQEVQQCRYVRDNSWLSPLGDATPPSTTSPDPILTSLAKLVAIQLDAQRAIISLVGVDAQYFIAESSEYTKVVSGDTCVDLDDDIWMGCNGNTSRDISLCHYTIQADVPINGYGMFTVPDLSKDPQFENYPYVKQEPHFRFYAGTPLISNNLRIGSFFVIDDRPRDGGLNGKQIEILGAMAKHIVSYLDSQRKAIRTAEIMSMSKGISDLLDDSSAAQTPREGLPSEQPLALTSDSDGNHETSKTMCIDEIHPQVIDGLRFDSTSEKVKGYDEFDMTPGPEPRMHKELLFRSCELLQRCLPVDCTVFYDASLSGLDDETSAILEEGTTSREDVSFQEQGTQIFHDDHVEGHEAVVSVLCSSQSSKSDSEHQASEHSLRESAKHMDKDFLQYLQDRFPSGQLWQFDSKGNMLISRTLPRNDSMLSRQFASVERDMLREQTTLLHCFPNALQILYEPLQDLAQRRPICAAFLMSTHMAPVFDIEVEGAFTKSFMNNVSLQWDRITLRILERKRIDVLSSISHEFRSPLHGILASTELLMDSDLTQQQLSYCEDLNVCGRTLLNTVTHMLDFTKLNFFGDSLEKAWNRGHGQVAQFRATDIGSSLDVYSQVDISELAEDSISLVTADWSHGNSSRSRPFTPIDPLTPASTLVSNPLDVDNAVDVVLDIDPGDWSFTCVPGAIQIVIMNLVGNSIKFTPSGHIWINISCPEVDAPKGQEDHKATFYSLTIVVKDSGIGMTDDFLQHRLFKPFSQETYLTPGNGLGLSVVMNVLKCMRGSIKVKSKLGSGTEIIVVIPLKRAHLQTPISSLVSDISQPTSSSLALASTVAVLGFEDGYGRAVGESIKHYVTDWYKLKLETDATKADHVIVDATIWDAIRATLPSHTLIVRGASVGRRFRAMDSIRGHPISTISVPFGPNTLRRALATSFALRETEKPLSLEPTTVEATHQPNTEKVLPGLKIGCDVQSDSTSTSTIRDTRAVEKHIHTTERPSYPGSAIPRSLTAGPSSVPMIENLSIKLDPVPAEDPSCLPTVRSISILCVDDNPINLKILSTYLKKLDLMDVNLAIDGQSASDQASSHPGFDLIFMDLSMPKVDGFESTRRIRAYEKSRIDGSRAYIAALSGLASIQDQERAFAAGVDHFLAKPLTFKQLKAFMSDKFGFEVG